MSSKRQAYPGEGSFFIVETLEPIVRLKADPADTLDALRIKDWSSVVGDLEMGLPQAVFTAISEDEVEEYNKLVATATQHDADFAPVDLKRFLRVAPDLGQPIDRQINVLKSQLEAADVYYDPPGIPPTCTPADNPYFDKQGYLEKAPKGIDALSAWLHAGGDGSGQKYIDLELGWTLDHEDLEGHEVTDPLFGEIDNDWRPHGTRSLGVISAICNYKGVVGIASAAKFDVVSYHNDTRPNAMLAAIMELRSKGVLLLEAQLASLSNETETFNRVPVELQPLDFKMIKLATNLGITVIEAAGNGNHDLATVTNKDGEYVLDGKAGDNSSHSDFQDSGAIMVGAAKSAVPHKKSGTSNYGRRLDCYSWGDSVWTTTSNNSGTDKNGYTGSYSRTSSASAIIAGAALSIQGIAENVRGFPLSALQMRKVLGNTATGTALDGGITDLIGVQPDLHKILQDDLIGAVADVYIRDNILDTGDPQTGALSLSPDIVVLSEPVLDPQAKLGEGSGTEDTLDLSDPVSSGADHYIYVRLRNRGPAAAEQVKVRVYWSPVSTLVTPDLWTLIGTANVASVPAAGTLTVSDAIVWTAASIPAADNYCFIAVASCATDPGPEIQPDLEWEHFVDIVRNNNNVTVRNFNFVEYAPNATSPLPDHVPVDFMVYGGRSPELEMNLEVHARLPGGSEVLLEMPPRLFENLRYRPPAVQTLTDGARLVQLNPHGTFEFESVRFFGDEPWPCRLHVKIERPFRENNYQVSARQVFQDSEVGRATWMFGPRRPRKTRFVRQIISGRTQMSVIDKVAKELKAEGFSDQHIEKVKKIVAENIPPRVYIIAVWFLGIITIFLVAGAFIVMGKDGVNVDPIWVAVGAGIGALAGIFSSNK